MTLYLTLLTACSNKISGKSQVNIKEELSLRFIVNKENFKCLNLGSVNEELKPVKFSICYRKGKYFYCLDRINAYYLYSNVSFLKYCLEEYKSFYDYICSNEKYIKCTETEKEQEQDKHN